MASPCHYLQEGDHQQRPSDLRAPSLATSHGGKSSVVGPLSPYSLENDVDALNSDHFQRGLLDLMLLHHYVTVLARTLPASKGGGRDTKSPDVRELYAVDTVQVAFKYPFLLNTIFAISALHKTQTEPEPVSALMRPAETTDSIRRSSLEVPARAPVSTTAEVVMYARAHRIYLNLAIRQQREALMELGPKNADAVCLTSVLLAFIALKILPDDPTNTEYEPPVRWLSMAHAISSVTKASKPFLPPDCTMRRLITNKDVDFTNHQEIYDSAYIAPFQAILDFPDTICATEDENHAYSLAVSYMSAIYRAIQNLDAHRLVARRIISTGPVLPKLFAELVEQRRPRALVVLAYIKSMTKYVEDYWFFRGAAEYEVYGIQSILPNEWQWAMAWPIDMLTKLAEPGYRNLEV